MAAVKLGVYASLDGIVEVVVSRLDFIEIAWFITVILWDFFNCFNGLWL